MALTDQFTNFASQVGSDIATIVSRIGSLDDLTTDDKSSLVAALVELKATVTNMSTSLGATIDDEVTNSVQTWSSSKISTVVSDAISGLVNGAPEALDTLKELAEAIETNGDAITALQTIAANHVVQSISSDTGTAYIWNETSGGGARYDHTDGSRSFVGVNNGGADDIAVQIYAKNNSTNVGTRINVYNKGAYYIPDMSNTDAAYDADGDEYEIAVKGDLPTVDTLTLPTDPLETYLASRGTL